MSVLRHGDFLGMEASFPWATEIPELTQERKIYNIFNDFPSEVIYHHFWHILWVIEPSSDSMLEGPVSTRMWIPGGHDHWGSHWSWLSETCKINCQIKFWHQLQCFSSGIYFKFFVSVIYFWWFLSLFKN